MLFCVSRGEISFLSMINLPFDKFELTVYQLFSVNPTNLCRSLLSKDELVVAPSCIAISKLVPFS